MTVGLASIPKKDRDRVASRRCSTNVQGLGYWGAHDYMQNPSILDEIKVAVFREMIAKQPLEVITIDEDVFDYKQLRPIDTDS